MKLYSFFFSSASYRVRIALNLKGIQFETIAVNLREGSQMDAEFVGKVSPSPLIPVLDTGTLKLSQSYTILDWLDRHHPSPKLIPDDEALRAEVLTLVNIVSCDIHPLNNLRVLKYLSNTLEVSPETRQTWYEHWIAQGFEPIERLLSKHAGAYCFGDAPSIADCYLIPQVANAHRLKCDMSSYPRISAVYDHALKQPAFIAASPQEQPDFIP
jgi:maleylacetoacetate isomerase